MGQAASGGLLAAVAICSQAVYQGQSVGRCRVSLRAEWLLVNVPARLALPQGKATLHLPEHWPWANTWTRLWQQVLTPRQNPSRASLTVHPPNSPTGTMSGNAGQTSNITTP